MSSVLTARQGRHRQLYEDNFRLVSGCIPYRVKKGYEEYNNCIEDCLEVLMVSSPSRHDLVFPKGGWENDESVHEAACREALEEAGVRGILNKTELGVWEFRSKSRQEKCSRLDGGCRGYMFGLEVTEELDCWPEQENHGRKWLDVREAFRVCRYEWMKDALRAFLEQMESDNNKTTKVNNEMAMAMAMAKEEPTAIAIASTNITDAQVSNKQTSRTNFVRSNSKAILAIVAPRLCFYN